MLATKKKPCCSSCRSGGTCSGKPKRNRFQLRHALRFVNRGGILLPDRYLYSPRAMLWPGRHEFESIIQQPWMPLMMPSIDMSMCPCCAGACCPDPPATLSVAYAAPDCPMAVIDGCVAPAGQQINTVCGPTADQCWNGSPEGETLSGCNDVLNHTIMCDDGSYSISGSLCNVLGQGTFGFPLTVVSCDPFELIGGGEVDTSCCQGTVSVHITGA